MKIKFWGTAAGLAEAHRHCTSVLIEINDAYYILDFGAPVEHLIAKEKIEIGKIKAAFVTHMHADHAETLVSFAKLYAKFTDFLYAPASVRLYRPDGVNAFYAWLEALNLDMSERMEMIKIEEGIIFDSEALRVKAVRTEHLGKDKPSYAFVFEAEGKKVLFTGDLVGDFHDFPYGEQYDLIVCELAHGEMHELKSCLERARCGNVIFYHMTSEATLIEKLGVNRIGVLEADKDSLGFHYQLAYDGMEIEL